MLLSAASAPLTHTYHGLTSVDITFCGDGPQESEFFSIMQLLVPHTSYKLCSSISEKQKLRRFPLQQQKGMGSCSAHSHTLSGLCVLLMLFLLLLGLYKCEIKDSN